MAGLGLRPGRATQAVQQHRGPAWSGLTHSPKKGRALDALRAQAAARAARLAAEQKAAEEAAAGEAAKAEEERARRAAEQKAAEEAAAAQAAKAARSGDGRAGSCPAAAGKKSLWPPAGKRPNPRLSLIATLAMFDRHARACRGHPRLSKASQGEGDAGACGSLRWTLATKRSTLTTTRSCSPSLINSRSSWA